MTIAKAPCSVAERNAIVGVSPCDLHGTREQCDIMVREPRPLSSRRTRVDQRTFAFFPILPTSLSICPFPGDTKNEIQTNLDESTEWRRQFHSATTTSYHLNGRAIETMNWIICKSISSRPKGNRDLKERLFERKKSLLFIYNDTIDIIFVDISYKYSLETRTYIR